MRTIQTAGLSRIDLRIVEGVSIAALPMDRAREVAGKLRAAGIQVGMFGSPLGKIDLADDLGIDLAKLDHLGQLAGVFQCRRVRVFSYFNEKAKATPRDRADETLRRLRVLKERAVALGLELYHENERDIFGDSVANVLQIVDALVDGVHFGTVFDFDNYNQCGEDVWQAWERLRDHTDAFHLKDSDSRRQHVPIGQGAGRAREILSDCLRMGWEGHLALEPHLAHSPAVLATGPGGSANLALANLSDEEAWQVGAAAGKDLLREIGAKWF